MATANPIPEDTSTAEHAAADLLVLAAAMQPEEFEGLMTHLAEAFSAESVIVAAQEEFAAHARGPLRVVPFSRSSPAWTMKPADFINAFEAGHEHEAKAVLMLGPGSDSLSPLALRSLAMRYCTPPLTWPCRTTAFLPTPDSSIRQFFIRSHGRCLPRGRDFRWRWIWASRCAWRSVWPRPPSASTAPARTRRCCGR